MDLDLDSDLNLDPLSSENLEENHNVLDSVEHENLPLTINPSFLGYDGIDERPRTLTPVSSDILARPAYAGLGASFISPERSNGYGNRNGIFSPPPAALEPRLPDQHLIAVFIPPARYKPLPYSTSQSGLVYDVRMRFHQHPMEAHPENPRRISEIFEELIMGGLYTDDPNLINEHQLVRIPIRRATIGEIMLVHGLEYIEKVQGYEMEQFDYLCALTEEDGDKNSVYYHSHSWEAASLAAGGAIVAARAVVAGQVKNAIAVIRPPGHHAEHNYASGFCFFNNVCIAAKVVQKDFPDTCRKILILDWDVHHGNGVQHAFYDDPNVLYISLHVYQNGEFYPLGDHGDHVRCGEGNGLGKNINIPWSKQGMGDAEYIYAFQQVVMPVAVEFDPDLVLISAGFDAADGDELGGCYVSPAGYTHMTHMLMQLAKGKVVACLEGGYGNCFEGIWNPRPVAKSAFAVTRTLMGEPPDRLSKDFTLLASAVKDVQSVIRTQSRFWKCLYPKWLDDQRRQELGSRRLHDVVRDWQNKMLWEEYKMSELFIQRERISQSFKNQVLATPNYYEVRPLLVIFHDPPEAMALPDPMTSHVELHNTWLTDVSKTYVDWAVKHDFAVIDVNIPKQITAQTDNTGYEEPEQAAKRAASTKELASYLWSNYLEIGDATHIFFLGVGDAYAGIIGLLSEHRNAAQNIDHTFAFVSENTLRKVEKPGDEGISLGNHFYRTSTIFVDPDHPAWNPAVKLRRRHGNVKKASKTGLQDMLAAHRDDVTETMLRLTEGWRSEIAEGMIGVENGDGSVNGVAQTVVVGVDGI